MIIVDGDVFVWHVSTGTGAPTELTELQRKHYLSDGLINRIDIEKQKPIWMSKCLSKYEFYAVG